MVLFVALLHTGQGGLVALAFLVIDACARPSIVFGSVLTTVTALAPVVYLIWHWAAILEGPATIWLLAGLAAGIGVLLYRKRRARKGEQGAEAVKKSRAMAASHDMLALAGLTVGGLSCFSAFFLGNPAASVATGRWGASLAVVATFYLSTICVEAVGARATSGLARREWPYRIVGGCLILLAVGVFAMSVRAITSAVVRIEEGVAQAEVAMGGPLDFEKNNQLHVIWHAASREALTGESYLVRLLKER
ncbi:MAG: hypothetical protein AAF628_20565 [Planctomycetota bacterium]